MKSRIVRLSLFLLLLVFGSLYFWILFSPTPSDLVAHNQILSAAVQEGKLIIPPVYYYLVWFFGNLLLFHPSYKFGALLVVYIAVAWKYLLTLDFFSKEINGFKNHSLSKLAFFSLSLMFVFPLILPFVEGRHWYLGKFTPTVWHNSTSVLVLPMCLMMYYEARKWLQSEGSISMRYILVWGGVVLLTKPSFLFVFIPAFPMAWILYNRSFGKGFWVATFISLLLLIGVWVEKSLIYHDFAVGNWIFSNSDSAKVELRPFLVFLALSDSEVWDVLSSFFFIGLSFIFLWRELKHKPEFWWNLVMLFGGMILYFSFVETGNRLYDGNFYWQIPISLYIFYLLLINQLIHSQISIRKKQFLWSIYSLHVISGVIYLIRWVLLGSNS